MRTALRAGMMEVDFFDIVFVRNIILRKLDPVGPRVNAGEPAKDIDRHYFLKLIAI